MGGRPQPVAHLQASPVYASFGYATFGMVGGAVVTARMLPRRGLAQEDAFRSVLRLKGAYLWMRGVRIPPAPRRLSPPGP
jgi:hypothetical protein